MILNILAFVALVLAAMPCGLFLVNLMVYRPLTRIRRDQEQPSASADFPPISAVLKLEPPQVGCYGLSVLIPARNEEQNIRATL